MLGNDEKPIKGKGAYNFSEYPEDSGPNGPNLATNFTICENNESVPMSRNERPLGGRGNYKMPPEETPSYQENANINVFEEAPEETGEEETGPLEKRIESKIWKTRTKAYEELFRELEVNSDLFEVYSTGVLKFISDSHPGAQEKGLEILQLFIQKSPKHLVLHSESIVKALIEKGVSSTKSSIKTISSALVLDFFAEHRENHEAFIQGLLVSLNNKNLKVQGAAISIVNSLMAAFGVRLIPFKPFLAVMEKFAGNSNPVVRGEALNFYKEAYRWARDLILPGVGKLKKPQQDELQKAFEEITEFPTPTRYLKHEEAKMKSEGNVKVAPKPIDIYEMADAKDIFTKFNDKWADGVLEMEKWVEKKNALEILNAEANYPKLAEKSPATLVAMAKRLINDANVNVMLQSVKLIGLLAKGQRKFFDQYAKQFFPVLLSKLKDKKTQVIQETYLGLENLLFSVSLEQVNDDIREAMEDKTPTLKINVTIWLQKIFSASNIESLTKSAKNIAMMGKKNIEDSIAEVRTESFKLLGVLFKKFPDQINPILKDFPPAKIKKIEEAATENSEHPVQEEEKKIAAKEVPQKSEKPAGKVEKVPAKKENPAKKETSSNKKEPVKGGEEEIGNLITPEEAESIMSALLPSETLEKLKEASWKDKLEGLQDILQWINSNNEKVSEVCDALFIFIKLSVKDWKENNLNVLKAAFEIIKTISGISAVSKRSAYIVLTSSALDKLAEGKVTESYCACLLALAEAVGPKFIVSQMIKNTSECSKPKVISECFAVILRIIVEFGIHKVTLKEVIDYAKNALNQANPVIKKAAQTLTVKVYSYIGESLLPLLSDVKEATLKVLQEDFSKTPLETSANFKCVRGEEEVKFDPKKVLDDVIPRANISNLITSEILKKLADGNWKVRKEGLDLIESILDKSGKRVLPVGLEELFKSLKARLEDSNKSIVRSTLTLVAKLAECLGPEAQSFNRVVVPGLLSNLADKQSLLRQDALATIDKWAAETGAESIVSYASTPLMQDNPELRTELLNWLLAHKDIFPKCDMKPMAPCILNCLQDRTANIRNAAELLYGEVIEFIGFDTFQPYLKDIKPAVMSSLKVVFEKYRVVEEPVETVKESKTMKSKPTLKKSSTKIPAEAEIKTPRGKGQTLDVRVVDVGEKEKRLDVDSRYKWSIEEIRPDYLDKLKEQMKIAFSPDLYSLMFHADFKKQAEAAVHLTNLIKSQGELILAYLDLLFKWCWIELIISSNTQIYKAVLEIDILIITSLSSYGYILTDTEANLILPVLCEKSGQNNSVFRSMIRNILHTSCKVYPADKVFAIVCQGINSKNARSKVECIEELGALIQEFGIDISSPKDIKFISKQVNSADNNVRTAAVDTMTEIFKIIGEKTWSHIGEVPDKVRGILDQRFRTVKVKPAEMPKTEAKASVGKNVEIEKKGHYDSEKRGADFDKRVIEKKSHYDSEKRGTDFEKKERNEEVVGRSRAKTTHNEGTGRPNKNNDPLDLQTIAEKLNSLEKVAVFTEEEDVAPVKPEGKMVQIVESLERKKENKLEEPTPSDEINLMKEETKLRKPIQEMRNAFKEKKLQKFRESIQAQDLKIELEPVISEFQSALTKLDSPDLSVQTDGLEFFNDAVLKNLKKYESDLQKHSSQIFQKIISISAMFLSDHQSLLQFGAYFFNIVQRICAVDFLIKSLKESELSPLCEKFLQCLSIEGLEKSGEANEGETISKAINPTVLKILELAVPDEIFGTLLGLIEKYKYFNMPKMNGILVRCILKLTRLLNERVKEMNIQRLLMGISNYLSANGFVTDELGIKAMKTILNELVKIFGDSIWDYFSPIKSLVSEETQIEKWINMLLDNSPSSMSSNPSNSAIPVASQLKNNSPIDEILFRLNSVEFYPYAIKELAEIVEKTPNFDLNSEIQKLNQALANKVVNDLMEIKRKKNETPSNYNFSDMQNRLAAMKQKYGIENQTNTGLGELNSKLNSVTSKPESKDFTSFKSRIQKFSKK